MLEGSDIVFLSGIRWDFSRQRHQELASLFARRNRVLFVEMALSPANLLKERRITLDHWKNWRKGVRKLPANLFLYTAPPVFPLGRSFPAINGLNQRIIYRGVKKAMSLIGMKRPIFWISDPYFSFFARKHGQRLTVFDWIHDDPGRTESRISRVYRGLLDEVVKKAQIIVTPSRAIYEKYGKTDRRFHLILHGVDYELFSATVDRRPADLESVPSPIIGFSGTVGPAVDLGLIEFLASERKDWSFVFLGDIRIQVKGLRSYPNIYFLGPRPRQELPHYIGTFSVGIIPYKITPATKTVHPVKTYEYLAAGLPIISTRLPELEYLRGSIELADTPEEFLHSLEDAIAKDAPDKKIRRREIAREYSWEKRMATIQKAIGQA